MAWMLTTVVPAAMAQVSAVDINVTAWLDCGPGAQNPNQAQYPLQCQALQTFTSVEINGTFSFDGGLFNETLIADTRWSCVGTPEQPSTQSLQPSNVQCTALPNNTRLQVTLLRPRYGWTLEYLFDTPYGYVQLNYTANMTGLGNSSYFLLQPDLLDNTTATGGNLTCGGVSNVQMNTLGGCLATLPPFIDSAFMSASGVCGANPYLPLLERAIVLDPDFQLLNGASCASCALCYPCNATGELPPASQQRVVYQTYAFGPSCAVYQVQPDPTLYVDVFINVTVNDIVSNGVYVAGVFDNGQQQTALSLRSPTIRGTVSIQAQQDQVQVRQLTGYIVVCPDPTVVNNTRPPGVLGNFNWLYNTSGYLPTFEINRNTYPGLANDSSVQSMNGAWFYLTADEFENRFQQGVQQPLACGLSQVVAPDSVTPPVGALYRNAAAVNASCAAPAYNASNTSTANSTLDFLSQVPLWQGACVPGTDPRFAQGSEQTVCQIVAAQQAYADRWAAQPSLRNNLTQVPYMPPDTSMYNSAYFLALLDQNQMPAQQNPPPVLMYTPPNFGRGITAAFRVKADISTDLVPYWQNDTSFVVVNVGASGTTQCVVSLVQRAGQYAVQVCQLGNVSITQVNISISDCPSSMVLLDQLQNISTSASEEAAQEGLRWHVNVPLNGTSAYFDTVVLQRTNLAVAPCFSTPILLVNLTQAGFDALDNVVRAVLGTCTVTLSSRVLHQDGNYSTVVQSTEQLCVAASPPRPLFIDNVIGNSKFGTFEVIMGVVLGAVVLFFGAGCIALIVYVAWERSERAAQDKRMLDEAHQMENRIVQDQRQLMGPWNGNAAVAAAASS